jgi:hypothetical protein
MKKLKKIGEVFLILFLLTLSFFPILVVRGQLQNTPLNVPNKSPIDIFNTILQWLYTIVFAVAALFIIIAAYLFITAQGNAEQLTRARNLVLYAVIGIIVGIAAWGLVQFVKSQLAP